MSSLVQDAICTETSVPAKNFADARINPQVLQDMLKDLDEREFISVIFLMVDKDTNFSRVIADIKEDPRTAFTRLTNKDAWTDKLLESLLVIKNKYILEKMAFDQNEIKKLEILFVTKQHNVSSYLNKAIKSLYFLCENLDDDEVIKLVKDVNDKLPKPLEIDRSKLCLELYVLEWLNQKYISIDPDNCNLSDLLKNLKGVGCSADLPFNFDYWKNCNSFSNKNEQDSQIDPQNCNNPSTSQCSNSENSLVNDSKVVWSDPDHKKLCIIVNQINFRDRTKYDSREGSEIDERTLKETFKGCGFKVVVQKDYTKQDMIELLDSLNSKNEYSTYGAIFICILSHGFQGEVVFSDDNALPIATIREKFCCRKLQKVFKFLILQSCQGKQIGMVERLEKHLVRDGPCNSTNPLPRMHFGLFQATVSDYAAMRHKKEGSWFIQDLCREIRDAKKPIEIRELIQKVKTRVTDRKVPYESQFAVQVPESLDTITIPYEIPKFERERIKLKEYNGF